MRIYLKFDISCFLHECVYVLLRSLKNGIKYINKTYNETYNEFYTWRDDQSQHFITIFRNFKNQSQRFMTLRILKTNHSFLGLHFGILKTNHSVLWLYLGISETWLLHPEVLKTNYSALWFKFMLNGVALNLKIKLRIEFFVCNGCFRFMV